MEKDNTNFIKKKNKSTCNAKMIIAFLSHHQAITGASQPDLVVSRGESMLTGLSSLLSHKTLIFLFNSTAIPSQEVLCCPRAATCVSSATSAYNQVKTTHTCKTLKDVQNSARCISNKLQIRVLE